MSPMLKMLLPTMLFCFAVDMLWLVFIAKNFYQGELGHLMRMTNGAMTPNWLSAVVVYFALAIGILFFVTPKFPNSFANTLFAGALLGFVVYTVYDCTNYAVLKDWPLKVTIIDIAWGTFLCAVTSVFALFCLRRWS